VGRDFRRLFAGTAISALGSEISELALPLLAILTFHATAEQVGLLRAAQFLPFLLFTLYAGVLVDRVRRRPLMIAADLGRFVVIGAVPLLAWAGLGMGPLYLLVFLAGAGTVVHQVADQAYLPTLVSRDQLLPANGRIAAAQSGAELSGQGIGGLLVAWLTAPLAVAVDALTYLLSAIALAGIRTPEPRPERRTGTRLRRELFEGIRYLAGSRLLRPLVGEAATYNIAYQVFSIALLLWLARDLRMSPVVIGVVLSLAAVGALGGALAGARISARYGFGPTMLVTMAIGNSAPLLLFAAPDHGPGAAVLVGAVFLVIGFGTALANVHNRSLRQSAVPDEIQGRVTAAYRLVSWGMLPLGSLAGGYLAAELGAYGALLAGAAGLAAATLWVAASPIPRLREAPAHV
jgi:MFS family permease